MPIIDEDIDPALMPETSAITTGTQTATSSTRKKTRGGSLVKGPAKKSGKPVNEIYPDAFLPITRESFKKISDVEVQMYYAFVPDPNPPSEAQSTAIKNNIDYKVRQVFFVYCNRKLLASVVTECLPHLDNRTKTFSECLAYAQSRFSTLKHRLLYENMYSLARVWLADFGKTEFRCDPRDWVASWQNGDGFEGISADDKECTKKWIYGRVDKTLFTNVFRSIAPILDWKSFENRKKKPFYYLKVLFGTMITELAFVVISESLLNLDRE